MELKLQDMIPFFEDEIDINSFLSLNEFCARFIILCKLKCGNISLKHNGNPLKLFYNCETPNEELANAIVIGRKKDLCVDDVNYQKDVSFFLNQYQSYFRSEVSVYISEKNRLAQILIDNDEHRFLSNIEINIILAVLPRLLPWYFAELPYEMKASMFRLIDNEFEFFKSELNVEIEKQGIKQKVLLKKITEISDKLFDNRIYVINKAIGDANRAIKNIMRDIVEISKNLRERKEEKNALLANEENRKKPVLDLIDFINVSNEDIAIEKIEGVTLYLSIITEMSIWQDEEYQAYVVNNSGNSYFFTSEAFSAFTKNDIHMLCDAIFNQRKIKVFFQSNVSINIENGYIDNYHVTDKNITNSMPHPHLNSGVFCMGNNIEHIAQYISNFQLVEALNCVLYSAKQFTIGDSYVGELFMNNLCNYQALQMPNGTFMNGKEAIQYMKEHKEEFND